MPRGAPGLQWISEAFPAFLSQRLASDTIFPLTREDRLRAYDRAGIPAEVQPTRASIYRLVEEMDVDYVLLGRYRFDGRLFTVTAQLLDMQHRKLSAEASESGALVNLIEVQTALAWDLLHFLEPGRTVDRQTFTSITPAIRLDAFENVHSRHHRRQQCRKNRSLPRSGAAEPRLQRSMASIEARLTSRIASTIPRSLP